MAAQNYSMNKTMLAVAVFAGLTAPVLADDCGYLLADALIIATK